MKRRVPNRAVVLLLLFSLCFAGCNRKANESKTLTEFSDSDLKIFKTLYFYPTTIRMLAKLFGNGSDQGFSEVKGAKVFFALSDNDPAITKELFASLQTGIKEEGFEVLMQMKSPGSNIHVFLNEGDIPDYVFFMRGDDGDLIVEINGSLSPESIREIMQMDLSKAADLFDLIPHKKEVKSDSLKIVVPEIPENE